MITFSGKGVSSHRYLCSDLRNPSFTPNDPNDPPNPEGYYSERPCCLLLYVFIFLISNFLTQVDEDKAIDT